MVDDRGNKITDYFNELDRRKFIEEDKQAAKLDCPLPIGYGQTVSQPSLVLNMTLMLDPQPDSQVLEIGTGSGYQTALLAKFSETVYTVERLEPLYRKAKERLAAEGFSNIHFKLGDGSLGWRENGPFDRIMVTASVSQIPEELLEQLHVGGKMIVPIGDKYGQELRRVEKDAEGKITSTVLEHVAFVRLMGKYE